MASDATADEVLVVHTAQLVLSPQNFMAFREYLAGLWSRGEREQFWAFWVVCPLVEHLPPPSVPISDITIIGDGPCQCAVSFAPRSGAPDVNLAVGYQLPFLGPWTTRAVLVSAGMGPQEAGERYFRDH